MRNLTVYKRFALIIAVLAVVFVSALVAQVMVLRETVIEERRTKVFDMVEAAKKILWNYEEKAKAGKISQADARQLAFDAIGAMRWGKSADYLGIYGAGSSNAGVTYVHANPKYINVNRWDYRDHNGQLVIQNIVGKARSGGGSGAGDNPADAPFKIARYPVHGRFAFRHGASRRLLALGADTVGVDQPVLENGQAA